jgi:hypothetical protein
MQQSPSWKANSRSASQEIPQLTCNLKLHYRGYKTHTTSPYPESDEFEKKGCCIKISIPLLIRTGNMIYTDHS